MRRGDTKAAILMILPFFVFFAAFVIYPIFINLYYGFTNYSFNFNTGTRFVGLSNYLRLFKDGDFLISLRNTAVYAMFSVILLASGGLLMAVALNKGARLIKAARTMLIVPYATSIVAASLIWLLLLDPGTGIVNKLLVAVGIKNPPSWFYSASFALPSLIGLNVWRNLGYVMIIFLAGLQAVPPELYEAATIDGAGGWVKLKSITLPAIASVTVFVVISCFIEAFKTFEQVKIITKGGPMLRTSTVVYQIYIRAFEDYQLAYASAMSTVLLVILAAITLANFKALKR